MFQSGTGRFLSLPRHVSTRILRPSRLDHQRVDAHQEHPVRRHEVRREPGDLRQVLGQRVRQHEAARRRQLHLDHPRHRHVPDLPAHRASRLESSASYPRVVDWRLSEEARGVPPRRFHLDREAADRPGGLMRLFVGGRQDAQGVAEPLLPVPPPRRAAARARRGAARGHGRRPLPAVRERRARRARAGALRSDCTSASTRTTSRRGCARARTRSRCSCACTASTRPGTSACAGCGTRSSATARSTSTASRAAATQRVEIPSDTEWRCLESPAWTSDTPRVNWGLPQIEVHDARAARRRLEEPDFDDSSWDATRVLTIGGGPPDCVLRRHEDGAVPDAPARAGSRSWRRRRSRRSASRAGTASSRRPELAVDKRLYEEPLVALPAGLVEDPDALLARGRARDARAHERDARRVVPARLRPHPHRATRSSSSRRAAARCSSSRPPRASPASGSRTARPSRCGSTSRAATAHTCRCTPRGRACSASRPSSGRRCAGCRSPCATRREGVRIRHVGALSTRYPVEHRGAFECSDPFLNELWKIGRTTLELCMHDGWEDCPGREQRQWLGDATVEYPGRAGGVRAERERAEPEVPGAGRREPAPRRAHADVRARRSRRGRAADPRLDAAVDPERGAALAVHGRPRHDRAHLPRDRARARLVRAADRPERPGREPAVLALHGLGGGRARGRGGDAERAARRLPARGRAARARARIGARRAPLRRARRAHRDARSPSATGTSGAACTWTASIRRPARRTRASRSTRTRR